MNERVEGVCQDMMGKVLEGFSVGGDNKRSGLWRGRNVVRRDGLGT